MLQLKAESMSLGFDMHIIDKIRNLFLQEALSSPLLFNDLASMEKYISESYTGRSLIELLQNADDADAKRFLVKELDANSYIAANDGRLFTEDDILSLCRSGASTKKRKGSTIGFRGIGFKSVVNYAETVHLVSGSIKTTFSRTLTKKLVSNAHDVPMIRIPHEFAGNKYSSIIQEYQNDGYNTFFVFEVSNQSLADEIKEFDRTTMLFLKTVAYIDLQVSQRWTYSIARKVLDNDFIEVQSIGNNKEMKWLVTKPRQENEKSSVAFKYNGEKIIDAEHKEAVIHSFMPTNNAISMPIKVNGDYSTDPSRTKIVIDEDTKHAADLCSSIIAKLIKNVISRGEDKYGIVNVIKKAQVDPLSQIRGEGINDILINKLREKLLVIISEIYGNDKEIYLQPLGITDDDFDAIICYLGVIGISYKNKEQIPGIVELMKAFGYKELPMEKCLEAMKEIECTEKTRETIMVDVINKSRIGIIPGLKDKILSAKLISFNSGVVPIKGITEDAIVSSVFEGAITEALTTISDYTSFAKSVGLKPDQLAMNQGDLLPPVHIIPNAQIGTKTQSFSKNHVIQKWRSVEKNVAAVLELMDDVQSVSDVSSQNMGYDLEAVLIDGGRRYYEVKSVNSLGEAFSFSNNEYTTAMQHRKSYYLAITCQNDKEITICFVADPVASLNLTKRVTRWEWVCSSYEGEVVVTGMQ